VAPPAPVEATAPDDVPVEEAPDVATSDPEEVTAPTEPPDPIYEEPIDPPGPGYAWVGGYWGWTGSDWFWYSGRWLLPPEGRVYVEPHYERVGPRVVFVGGYWGAHDAPPRSYGGERIRFAPPVRPADYRRGERPRVERRAVGVAPGARPARAYERAAGPARPLPRATAPSSRPAAREPSPARPEPAEVARRANAGSAGAAGHEGVVRETPGSEGLRENNSPHQLPPQHGPAAPHEGLPAPRAAPQRAPTPTPTRRAAPPAPKKKKE
jgi:hypothetical protein